MNVCSPFLVNISVYSGHVTEGFTERSPLAATLIERWYMAPGVQRISVKERGVHGTLFLPPGARQWPFLNSPVFKVCPELCFVVAGPGPYPGLLDMWGGGGGLIEYRSALLASRGYISLALEYLKPLEMQPTELAFNYFEVCVFILIVHTCKTFICNKHFKKMIRIVCFCTDCV